MPGGHSFRAVDHLLGRSLDAQSLRLRVLADNIANVNTPGFKRSEVRFETMLRQALDSSGRGPGRLAGWRTHPGHVPLGEDALDGLRPRVVTDNTSVMRNDGNNVDIEREMAEVTRANIFYNAVAQQVTQRYQQLRAAIREGR